LVKSERGGDDVLLITYENQRVEKKFSDFDRLAIEIGKDLARTLKKRMNELSAAPSFQSFLSLRLGKPHSLSGNLDGYFGIHLTPNVRLIVKPSSADNSAESLSICGIVIVKGVSDYHGGKENWIVP
jgi:plasmid maintenance system killer protein